MANTALEFIELNSKDTADASVIWLHGLGANGHDFEPIVPHLKLSGQNSVRFIFPHALERPVTVNNGQVMRAWYDIIEQSINKKVDMAGIEESTRLVSELIDQEVNRGIPASRIILAGFSQGGLIALQAGLEYPSNLAGIVALSTYIADPDRVPEGKHEIFMGHGRLDPVVPIVLGERARDALISRGHPVKWHSYPMEHSVCMEEIADIGQWISGRLI